MPVVSMMRLAGEPDDLLARMNERLEHATGRLAAKHGCLLNLVLRDGDDGVLIVNVWETDEGRRGMAAEPDVQGALAEAGLPTPQFESYDVVGIRATDLLAGHMETMS